MEVAVDGMEVVDTIIIQDTTIIQDGMVDVVIIIITIVAVGGGMVPKILGIQTTSILI
jgi:hypothetical protein